MQLIDSHCHLDVSEFALDLPETLMRAQQAGVSAFVVPAIDFESWSNLSVFSHKHTELKPAYGLHPMFLDHFQPSHLTALPEWLEKSECVAVGECGLDFFIADFDAPLQERIFIEHIVLAKQFQKPLIIHARKSTERVIQLLKQFGPVSGVIHSYSGSLEQAQLLIKMGFLLGIGGPITYPRSNRIRALVQEIPLDFLLIETDAPDQPLYGEQGRRNEPMHLAKIAQAIADVKNISIETVAEQTTMNAQRLFCFSIQ
ncbi:MAG TPA: TatD family hydrolase [Arenimonas sp.]|nr:TatD family hydrolase [Arenimonas sp.]